MKGIDIQSLRRDKRRMWGLLGLLAVMAGIAILLMYNARAGQPQEVATSEIVVAIGGEPDDGFDPLLGWGRYGSPLFQNTLLRYDADMNIVGDLATDWQVQGEQWTIELRQDVTFHDGQPLTAEDVVFTFEQAKSAGGVVDLTTLTDVEQEGRYTVVFTLREPDFVFYDRLITLGIVPAHAHDEQYAQNPIGSGPYRFVRWDKGQQLIVEANPDYYAGQPQIEKITFVFTEPEASLAAARTGSVDIWCHCLTSTRIRRLRGCG